MYISTTIKFEAANEATTPSIDRKIQTIRWTINNPAYGGPRSASIIVFIMTSIGWFSSEIYQPPRILLSEQVVIEYTHPYCITFFTTIHISALYSIESRLLRPSTMPEDYPWWLIPTPVLFDDQIDVQCSLFIFSKSSSFREHTPPHNNFTPWIFFKRK